MTLTPFANWARQHSLHHGNWSNLDRRSGADLYSACLTVREYLALFSEGDAAQSNGFRCFAHGVELLLKAVRQHTDCRWVLLYVERWLKAPVQMEDGSIVPRTAGTPQGGVISPLLANLFMHYSFDMWMSRTHPHIPFERYADDGAPRRREEEVTM